MESFGHAVDRLQVINDLEVLQQGDAMIAISGSYQGKIFTSTSNGMHGKSYGWINWNLIDQGTHVNNIAYLGGESRLWFGPERSEYSLFFPPGKPQTDEYLSLPPDMYEKMFSQIDRTSNSITYGGSMSLRNANNYIFEIGVKRRIALLSKSSIEEQLNIQISDGVPHVAFSAETTMKNAGSEQHKKENGLIAIWELGCMLTAPDNIVIIPLRDPKGDVNGYFTPIGDRMEIINGIVFYKADALGLNKIGIPPSYCKNVMGSYSPSMNLLNIVTFSFEQDSFYVNSIPENSDPYAGDVINIFNGEVNSEMNWNFPFYEFESSSSARELRPLESITHVHTTFHFEGSKEELNIIARQVLGTGLDQIPK